MPLFRQPPQSDGTPRTALRLSDDQRRDWLHLLRTPSIGPVTFWRLLNYAGSAKQALRILPEFSRRAGRKTSLQPIAPAIVEAELKAARKLGAELVARGEPGYPELLSFLPAPPPLLYVKGDKTLASKQAVAMIGSRNGSALGQKFTRQLATELSEAGYCIVSGLARGIDASAHAAALDQAGGTMAVIAGGPDNYYPPQNADLQKNIEKTGLVISETPPGHEPRAQDFPRRNRIISGSSLGTLVVEAGLRSGSLITARLAGEQGREVMAVPGHPLDPRAAGANRLLMNGASMITSAQDIVDLLSPLASAERNKPANLFEFDPEPIEPESSESGIGARDRVRQALSLHPVAVDELIDSSGLEARDVHICLLELELAGEVICDNNLSVRLCPPE